MKKDAFLQALTKAGAPIASAATSLKVEALLAGITREGCVRLCEALLEKDCPAETNLQDRVTLVDAIARWRQAHPDEKHLQHFKELLEGCRASTRLSVQASTPVTRHNIDPEALLDSDEDLMGGDDQPKADEVEESEELVLRAAPYLLSKEDISEAKTSTRPFERPRLCQPRAVLFVMNVNPNTFMTTDVIKALADRFVTQVKCRRKVFGEQDKKKDGNSFSPKYTWKPAESMHPAQRDAVLYDLSLYEMELDHLLRTHNDEGPIDYDTHYDRFFKRVYTHLNKLKAQAEGKEAEAEELEAEVYEEEEVSFIKDAKRSLMRKKQRDFLKGGQRN